MSRRRFVLSVSVIFLLASVVPALSQYQQFPSPSADKVIEDRSKLDVDAHPYLDAPFPELKKAVHELAGMTPASSQDQLPDLLDKVGAKADELLQRVPDLVCEEAVSQSQYVMAGPGRRPASTEYDQTFQYQYLILTHPGGGGRSVLSESRTRKGKSVANMIGAPNFQGFLSAWTLFSSANQVESRFRYLGQQQIGGKATFVIGFAPTPGSIASLAQSPSGGAPLVPMQGIAWVDQSDFRILRLRTDLLAPQTEAQLLKQTAIIVFGAVEMAQPNLELWLPQQVDFEMKAKGQFFHEDHKYSHYRLNNAAMDTEAGRGSLPSPLSSSASSEPNDAAKAEAARLYADAHPYMDEPLAELKKTVHDLGGLTPAPSQDELSELLAKTGSKADELLQKVPDLISDEAVSQSQHSASHDSLGDCVGTGCVTSVDVRTRDTAFQYMILTHPAQDGRLTVSEYRTTRNGKPVGLAAGGPAFQGFISAWIVFSSLNQVESRFRYLGQQRVNKHTTYVVGFAQTPGTVESPGEIVVGGRSIPMLLQGIAWIDQSDFRIVRLRTDLLAPQAEIQIETQTANIQFGAVHIANLATELWLPEAVNLQMEFRGQLFQEDHKYSKYRLYQAKSRIVLSPEDEPASR
jgi:hypothetical protein